MAFLVVGGLTIPVQPGNAQRDWSDAVDRSRAFDNTYRASATGGGVRDWHFTTPPVTRVLADTYEATLRLVGAQVCSGDVLGGTMMCCAEIDSGWSAIKGSSSHYVTLPFTLHEVQGATLLLKYAAGDTITGESFTRSTVAYQMNTSGVYVSKAINTKRDGHFTAIGGIQSLLLEGARTNSILRSNDMGNATWTKAGTGSATLNAVGLDGTASTASTLVDSDAAAFYIVQQQVTISNNNDTHCASIWIKKDTDQTRFVGLDLEVILGTLQGRYLNINTQTGAIGTRSASVGSGSHRVVDAGLWWVVEITVTNNTTGNTALRLKLYPALGTVFGTPAIAAQGSCIVGQVQFELNSTFYSSPIVTTTVAVARGADFYSLPFTELPKEMSVFTKYTDLGTAATLGSFVFDISNAANTGARFLSHINGGLTAYHHNGGAPVESAGLAAASYGNVVELLTRLYGDGSVDATQSLNSAAATSSAITGAQSLPAAWSGQLVWINSPGTVAAFNGFGAYQSFKIVGGARTLTEMRGA